MNDCYKQTENNKEVPLRENRNLAEMAQEALRLDSELMHIKSDLRFHASAIDLTCGAIVEDRSISKFVELIKHSTEELDRTVVRIENIRKALAEMHVFLAREAAFGQNCK